MAKISIKVKPNSKQDLVEPVGENEFVVRVKEKAIEGRANDAVIELLSDYFDLPKSAFSIVKGLKSRLKIINVRTFS